MVPTRWLLRGGGCGGAMEPVRAGGFEIVSTRVRGGRGKRLAGWEAPLMGRVSCRIYWVLRRAAFGGFVAEMIEGRW